MSSAILSIKKKLVKLSKQEIDREFESYAFDDIDTVVSSVEKELEEIAKKNPQEIHRAIVCFDRNFRATLKIMFSMFDTVFGNNEDYMNPLYRLRLEPRFVRLGFPETCSEELCRVLSYARIGLLSAFTRGGFTSYIKECVELMEKLSEDERDAIRDISTMDQFMEDLTDSRDSLDNLASMFGSENDDFKDGNLWSERLEKVLESYDE